MSVFTLEVDGVGVGEVEGVGWLREEPFLGPYLWSFEYPQEFLD